MAVSVMADPRCGRYGSAELVRRERTVKDGTVTIPAKCYCETTFLSHPMLGFLT